MRRPGRRWVFLGLGAIVSGLLFYLSFRKIDVSLLGQHIGMVSLPILAMELLVRFANFSLAALRSMILFRAVYPFRFWFLFKSGLLAFAVNNVIPFRAGEVARIGYLSSRGNIPAESCLAIIGVERLFDVLAIFVIVMCCLPAMAIDIPIGASVYMAAGVMMFSVGVMFWISQSPERFVRVCVTLFGLFGTRARNFAKKRAGAFANGLIALKSPTTVMAAAGVTLLFWLLAALGIQIWIWAFGFSLPWYSSVVVLAFLSFGLAVPSTPGHLGTYHFFAASAMITIGLPQSHAVAFAVVGHGMAVVPYTLLTIPLLFSDFTRSEVSGSD